MREVRNDTDLNFAFVYKNRYGTCLEHFTLKAGESGYLPLYSYNRKLLDSSNRELFIYNGRGVLNLSECYTRYDFGGVSAHEIDWYLQNGSFLYATHYGRREKIKAFVELLEINASHGGEKVLPPYYEDLCAELFCGV